MSNQDHAYALPSGFMLEEYQIERVLGSGGFGITYYAWDRHLDKAVAIKEYLPNEFAVRYEDTTVAPKSSSDAETYEWGLRRFLEEARILAGFDHPNINKVYRRLEAHGTAYMVLEYLPGESLSARLKRTGRLSPEEVWRLFNEILSGLAEVHRQDYVHRDIKPGNIMFREDGGAVLLDFGAARQAVGQRSKSITSILTPGYAPLEQYDQKAADVGPWSDFYALGVVAYRCVTGVGEGELLDAVARARLVSRGEREKDMRPVVELAKGQYDQRLLKAIDSCMRVDERERPQGVSDLEAALADGASKKKKKPKPAPKPKPESKPRHPAIWAAVGAVVALLLGFGAWQWFSPSPPAPAPLADDPGEASAPAVVPASPPQVAAEPGSLMLELSPADARVILPDIESPYRPGMALAAGSYRVVVRQAGYEEFAGTLRIEAGRRTTRTITLAQEPGSLVLELEPRDAQVMLPDIESSYRPGLELPAGEYRVVVRREGYEAFEDTLRIEAGRRTVRAITLVEAAGSLVLELSPADAQVSLPDSRLPYRPGMALPAGEYRVLVRRAGYVEFSGALRIEAGRRTTRAITLVEEPGSLMLELEPADAQVSLPGIESPYRPGLALPAGEYRVVVRREGYEAFDNTLRIEAGQRTTRAITLVEELGSLMLEIEPRDARVILPDIGPRYRPGLALPAGEYRVVVRQAGYEEFEGTVRIEAGQRTTRAITLRRTLAAAAEQGDAEAQFKLGEMYREGQGVPQDDEAAVKWYALAADQGHAKARTNLGWMYKEGRGVRQDDEEAVKWFRLAAAQEYARAQAFLGVMYRDGRGVRQDDGEAVKWFRLAAEQGDAIGQFYLGWMYENGYGVPKDDEEAVKWYRLAAEQGNADAQNNLGVMYEKGRGVRQDDEEAVKWYRLAAEQGDATAQNNLGLMYEYGRGVRQDDEEAVKWYRLAAEQGNASGQFYLGWMYDKGRGVRQDDEEAVKWYRLAAEQGRAAAQTNLGFMYDEGRGVPRDDEEAVKWYRLAAEQGSATAQNNLGLMYREGEGVRQDDEMAVKWFRLAAEQGHADAQSNLERLTRTR